MSLDWDLMIYDMDLDTPIYVGWSTGAGGNGNPSGWLNHSFDGKTTFKYQIDDGTAPQVWPTGGVWTFAIPAPTGPIKATVTDHTIQVGLYFEKMDDTSYFRISFNDSSTPSQYFRLNIYKSKLELWSAVGGVQTIVYSDFNAPLNSWMIVRALKKNDKLSLWINNQLYFFDIPADNSGTYGANSIFLCLAGGGVAYVDYCYADSTAEHISDSPLVIGEEKIVVRYVQSTDSSDYPNGVEALRFEDRSIPLVETNDMNASIVRIFDGTSVKSLMKLPI